LPRSLASSSVPPPVRRRICDAEGTEVERRATISRGRVALRDRRTTGGWPASQARRMR
jgi:hypothetical protein